MTPLFVYRRGRLSETVDGQGPGVSLHGNRIIKKVGLTQIFVTSLKPTSITVTIHTWLWGDGLGRHFRSVSRSRNTTLIWSSPILTNLPVIWPLTF